MPTVFTELATEAADWAGYDGFAPDACLINRYEPCGEAHEVKGYDALMRLHEADPRRLDGRRVEISQTRGAHRFHLATHRARRYFQFDFQATLMNVLWMLHQLEIELTCGSVAAHNY